MPHQNNINLQTLNLPQDFIQKVQTIFPDPKVQNHILNSLISKPTTFRLNTLQNPPQETIASLRSQGFQPEKSPFHPHSFHLTVKTQKDLQQTQEYKQGHIYLQSFASQIPVIALDPKPQEKILDMTAAPGSKTSQIAAYTDNKSELHANDVNTIRLQKLKHNLQKLNAQATVHNLPGTDLHTKFPKNHFHKILLDAPCSGEARFDIHNPKSYHYWSNHRADEFHQRQLKLLKSAWHLLAPGGVLVYSTCTFEPLENEKVIQKLSQENQESLKILPIKIPGLKTLPSLPEFSKSELSKTIRIYPDNLFESFFIAKLQKQK